MNPLLPNAPAGGGEPAPGAASGLMADLRGSGSAGDPAPGAEGAVITPAKRKPKMNIQTLVTALMIVASGASLFMMRKQGTRAGVKFQNVKIDLETDKTPRLSNEQQKILSQLAQGAAGPATPAEHLEKNPFKLEGETTVIAGTDQPTTAVREEEIRRGLAGLEVNAVMDGPVPVARIGTQLVKVGDTVADLFTVADIRDRSVDLSVDGRTFTISMPETRGGGNPAPGRPQPSRMPNFGPPQEPRR
jgi:hypothetical protein